MFTKDTTLLLLLKERPAHCYKYLMTARASERLLRLAPRRGVFPLCSRLGRAADLTRSRVPGDALANRADLQAGGRFGNVTKQVHFSTALQFPETSVSAGPLWCTILPGPS